MSQWHEPLHAPDYVLPLSFFHFNGPIGDHSSQNVYKTDLSQISGIEFVELCGGRGNDPSDVRL